MRTTIGQKRGWLVVLLAVAALVGARIFWVNATAFRVPEERHEVGEWVALDGAFHDVCQENTDGYALRVSKVELMSVADYLGAYGAGNAAGTGTAGTADGGAYPDVASLVVLTIDVRNEGNTDGGINLIQCRLLSTQGALYYQEDPTLWALSEPAFSSTGELALSFAIAAGTQYTVHVPYVPDVDDNRSAAPYSHAVVAGDYELVLSLSPVVNIVDVTLPEG